MLLKKAIIMGIATLSTVSAVGISSHIYAEMQKKDNPETPVMDVSVNSTTHDNLTKAPGEEDGISTAQANTDATGVLSDTSASAKPEAPETITSKEAEKISEQQAKTSASSQNDTSDKTSNQNPSSIIDPENKSKLEDDGDSKNSQTQAASNNGSASKNSGSSNEAIPQNTNAAPASSGSNNASAATNEFPANPSASSAQNNDKYKHTTSVYTDDKSTLLRVEYYDNNDKLCEYSSVSNYDKETNSYTETVYQYDDVNDVEITVRTDTYVNGELTSSETP